MRLLGATFADHPPAFLQDTKNVNELLHYQPNLVAILFHQDFKSKDLSCVVEAPLFRGSMEPSVSPSLPPAVGGGSFRGLGTRVKLFHCTISEYFPHMWGGYIFPKTAVPETIERASLAALSVRAFDRLPNINIPSD